MIGSAAATGHGAMGAMGAMGALQENCGALREHCENVVGMLRER